MEKTKTKKALCVWIALLCLLGSALFPAFAAETTEPGKGELTVNEEEKDRPGVPVGLSVAALCCAGFLLMMRKKPDVAAQKKTRLRFLLPFLKRHRIMLLFLLFLIPYEIVFSWQFGHWEIGQYPYTYHAMDYSVGFVSRILPGAISNLLFREITVLKVTVFETVLLFIFFVCLSFILEKLYLGLKEDDRPYGLLLIFLFITGPCSFGIYVKELGMLDAWWLYCAVFILFLLFKKKLRPLIILFAFVMILIYYASILCFAPFIVILLLYKATSTEDPRDRRRLTVIAWSFAAVAIGAAIYFSSFELDNLRLTQEEFYSLLRSRGCTGNLEDIYTIVYVVPPETSGITPGTEAEILNQTGMHSYLLNQIYVRLRMHFTIFAESSKIKYVRIVYSLILISPLLAMMLSFFRYKRKTGKDRMQKFSFFCMSMLFFFVNLTSLFVSTDTQKWLAHSFMLTFACFLFVLYHEPQAFREKIRPLMQKIPVPVWIIYCLIYAATVFHPYS